MAIKILFHNGFAIFNMGIIINKKKELLRIEWSIKNPTK